MSQEQEDKLQDILVTFFSRVKNEVAKVEADSKAVLAEEEKIERKANNQQKTKRAKQAKKTKKGGATKTTSTKRSRSSSRSGKSSNKRKHPEISSQKEVKFSKKLKQEFVNSSSQFIELPVTTRKRNVNNTVAKPIKAKAPRPEISLPIAFTALNVKSTNKTGVLLDVIERIRGKQRLYEVDIRVVDFKSHGDNLDQATLLQLAKDKTSYKSLAEYFKVEHLVKGVDSYGSILLSNGQTLDQCRKSKVVFVNSAKSKDNDQNKGVIDNSQPSAVQTTTVSLPLTTVIQPVIAITAPITSPQSEVSVAPQTTTTSSLVVPPSLVPQPTDLVLESTSQPPIIPDNAVLVQS